ncbi:protein of unknown function DUF523 [Desulfovibrio sp. X2]|uniref:YbgA family protein n=1 Tax=Desulfovibrio sp. X2 TaxID=941449 RepID=UPI000358A5BA|nr:DUF523 and DUF1722 domain-containing protein [Desulfovibrio sp. X2]EPR42661.1 protein of unknown function DUF523 [Desulfovibrio sp. X2]
MRLRLGVSSCLLGAKVRHDGGHRLDRWIHDTLGAFVDFVPVCPETECGLPVPREAMRLVGDPAAPRLAGSRSGHDFTAQMKDFCARRVAELAGEDLCGFIFKAKSPSSGLHRIKVYDERGIPRETGVGLFARAFQEAFPLLPCEDDGRLHDPGLRENFLERVFTMLRWREMLAEGPGLGELVDFHTRHKMLILAHSQPIYREMGRLVAAGRETPLPDLLHAYQDRLMAALAAKTTPRRQLNVLQHAAGHLKTMLTADEKAELGEVFGHYADEHVPLIVPVTLLNHYVRKYGVEYLARQVYLNPHPIELKLRNHA